MNILFIYLYTYLEVELPRNSVFQQTLNSDISVEAPGLDSETAVEFVCMRWAHIVLQEI